MVQNMFPNMSLLGEYTGLAKRVRMACSRCGGEFVRIAQSNLSRDCPICFEVYSKLYGGPPGFYDTIEGVNDIRELGWTNTDEAAEAPDKTIEERAAEMSDNMWANLLKYSRKKFNQRLEDALEEAKRKHGLLK